MERHRIAIVIPALNEAATIEEVVRAVSAHGIPLVVDDGSNDDTGTRAQSAGATVVVHPKNLGYDRALDSGFQKAAALDCNYVITADADGQHDPSMLAAFVRELDAGADLVAGVRDRRQRFGEYVFSWVGRCRWGLSDPLCGLKGYQMQLYRERGHFDTYGSIGTELSIFAARRSRKIVQIPVHTRPRHGRPRFGSGISANCRILFALWRGLFVR
jgi:glycosyltransferase involved in cell wall biosynthesis